MTSYNKLTFASLKELLAARGLPTTGTKAQLIARLKQQDRESDLAEKAMADAIQAASVAPPLGDKNEYGGKGMDCDTATTAKKGKKGKKGRMNGGKEGGGDVGRREKEERSVAMRRARLARRVEGGVGDGGNEVLRLMRGGEMVKEDGGVGDIVVNSTRKGHAKGLAGGRNAVTKQERSECVSEDRPAGYEKADYVVLRLLLAGAILAVVGALLIGSGTTDELLSWIAGLWGKFQV